MYILTGGCGSVAALKYVPLFGRKRDMQRADGANRMCVAITNDYGALFTNIFLAAVYGDN